ncbi:stage III sporulation protein AF [Bacillus tianshenii]|nr:stage III sporulation protein AF [Bacillus tianshenii]
MEYLSNWMTNIVLFILLAVVVDMLLPNSSMQNYAKMVIGLLLILLILTPILRFFSEDFESVLKSIEMSDFSQNEQLKNKIEEKKKEIQAGQRAYILDKTAVQMKENVQEELMNEYGYEIADIELQLADGTGDDWTTVDIQQIAVVLMKKATDEVVDKQVEEVKIVQIDVQAKNEQPSAAEVTDYTHIRSFLESRWGISDEKITISSEGVKGERE